MIIKESQNPVNELTRLASIDKATQLSHFFKSAKGEYGEGDQFLGITVPIQRSIAKRWIHIDWNSLTQMIQSPYHEIRLTTLLILIEKYQHKQEPERCIAFYLNHIKHVNNWDLVDLSCYKLLGHWLQDKERTILHQLASSNNLWQQRIAVVSCMAFIRNNDFSDFLVISKTLLTHPHDLIHKAIGWLLREMGKRDKTLLISFLEQHHNHMPRTMVRYAIERLPDEERAIYIKQKKNKNRNI